MKKLVFTETALLDEEPFTTSEIIAEQAGIGHHTVTRLIRKYQKDLEEFGVNGFEIHKPTKGSKGGRPTKVYHLNEEQATLLITYLDNTEPVRTFKKELALQFFSMKDELMKRQALREMEKSTRLALTDAIKDWSYVNNWSYKQITDLICKTITGRNTKQLKQERNVPSDVSATDIYTSEEMVKYEHLEHKVITLLELDVTYEQVKDVLSGQTIEFTILIDKEKALNVTNQVNN
ncbi:Phage protein [Tetragenococcus halophilus subsp. halophilus]|uniref:Rha family transcriptional regulator n=1 Tax=Tetragenococcus halophilus TaxID=51669 RepID=UPI000CB80FF5|nr:Rha family transcriptional regulator [Tetragenococcus halophilus]GBD80492.1 Phage protein [Tetragenococcus halophilus subsp. halophilus]GBD81517.1 Phage protein [Tetragenococcus halophilus subsp. halophilus]